MAVDQDRFITAYLNGTISLWNSDTFEPIYSRNLSELISNFDLALNDTTILKLFKLESSNFVMVLKSSLKSNINLILNDSNFDLIFIDKDINQTTSKLVSILKSDQNHDINIYSDGLIRYFTSILYLDKNNFDEPIEISKATPLDCANNEYEIRFTEIPTCLVLFDENKQQIFKDNRVSCKKKLSYKLVSDSCDLKEKLNFKISQFRDKDDYEISIILKTSDKIYPDAQVDSKIKYGDDKAIEINLINKDDANISKIKILNSTGKIVYRLLNNTYERVFFNKDYDSRLNFSLLIDEEFETGNNTVNVQYLKVDDYGVSSNIINFKINIFLSKLEDQHWYTWFLIICGILVLILLILIIILKYKAKNEKRVSENIHTSESSYMKI